MSDPLREIAEALEAEAACVWGNVEGAMAAAFVSTATGNDLAKILAVPHLPAGFVLPRAHAREPLPQVLGLAGLRVVDVGTIDGCGEGELRAALPAATGAVAVTGGRFPEVADLVWACREAGTISVVIAHDDTWRGALDAGADLVVLGVGLPAGVVVGKAQPILACALQARGLGRLFPASKAQLDAVQGAALRLAEHY